MLVKVATLAEHMYMYTQSAQISAQAGLIGYLRADMDSDGEGFFSTWNDYRKEFKTDRFKEEFDQVINRLRFGAVNDKGIRTEDNAFLKNRSTLAAYCWNHPFARMKTEDENYGFRVDTDNYTYLMRVSPNKGEYNLYCYCYRRDWLDQHMHNAERGIRFIDSHYKDLFKVPDGGKVRVTYYDGEVREVTCRYIDDYHLELGHSSCNLFHICELAERMEKAGNRIEPIDELPEAQTKEEVK